MGSSRAGELLFSEHERERKENSLLSILMLCIGPERVVAVGRAGEERQLSPVRLEHCILLVRLAGALALCTPGRRARRFTSLHGESVGQAIMRRSPAPLLAN